MVSKQELINTLKKALSELEKDSLELDAPVLATVDEGGYTEGYRLLSFFDFTIRKEDEDEEQAMCLLDIELGFED